MFDRIFSAVLAFAVLCAATIAIGAAMLEEPTRVVQLPAVVVTGKRAVDPQVIAQRETDAATAVR